MQDYPFERLIQKLNPERELTQSPIYRTLFNVVTNYSENKEFFGIEEESWIRPELGATQVDLYFDLRQNPDNLELTVEYNADLFEANTIQRMLRQYQRLLESMVREPEKRIRDLELWDPQERDRVTLEWNRTEARRSRECVHQVLDHRARLSPGNTAVESQGRMLTYGELNCCADGLARRFARRGVRPSTVVGVHMRPSVDLVAAVYGILKAGAAYVLLDPADPPERVNIVKGVHQSIASRALSLLKAVGINGAIGMSGGVAKNKGVVRALQELLNKDFLVPENPQIVGALGAALFGQAV